MNFNLTDDQRLIRDSVDRYLSDNYGFEQRRKSIDTAQSRQAHWRSFAELGWLGLPFPEDLGGLGDAGFDTMVLLESFGRHLVVEPYLWSMLVCGRLVMDGVTGDRRTDLASRMTNGTLMPALAWAEAESRADPRWCATSVRRETDRLVINGRKTSVFDAESADMLFVTARASDAPGSDGGLSLLLLDRATRGIEIQQRQGLDGRPIADIVFDEVIVPLDAEIASQNTALGLVERALDDGRVGLAAECLGSMDYLIGATAEYIKTREQFGHPLARFQVLQHRMADLHIAIELARSLTYLAASSLAADVNTRKRNVSAAKVQVSRAARLVGQQAVQLHGGMGMADELPISHHFTRLTMSTLILGEESWHLKRFAEIPAAHVTM